MLFSCTRTDTRTKIIGTKFTHLLFFLTQEHYTKTSVKGLKGRDVKFHEIFLAWEISLKLKFSHLNFTEIEIFTLKFKKKFDCVKFFYIVGYFYTE